METKHTYSLCPKTGDARRHLYEKALLFADRQHAKVIDRGPEARQELSDIRSGVLKKTGGDLILLTIESPEKFRISITNIGLKEKIVLAVRLFNGNSEIVAVDRLMSDLGQFWAIQRVGGGITDDPPC